MVFASPVVSLEIMVLDNDVVLLDVIDPEKKKKLDDAAEPGNIWHADDDEDDDDGDGGGVLETRKGLTSCISSICICSQFCVARL